MNDLFKRVGSFKITRDIIESNPEGVTKALNDILIVAVDNDFVTNSLIYKGYSKHFDLLENDRVIPEYMATMHTDKGKLINVTWNRVKEYTEKSVKDMLDEINKNIKMMSALDGEVRNANTK